MGRGKKEESEREDVAFSSPEETEEEGEDGESQPLRAEDPEFRTQMKEHKKMVDENVASLTEEELKRYGLFRTTGFNKGGIRRFVGQVLGQSANPNFTIVLSGIAKVFVGEVIEEARTVQAEWKDKGELLPSHIDEAYRRLYHRMPNMHGGRL